MLHTALAPGLQPFGTELLRRAIAQGTEAMTLAANSTAEHDPAVLDRAISSWSAAVAAEPSADHLSGLAFALNRRFREGGDPADLDWAIGVATRGTECGLRSATVLSNLGSLLRTRFLTGHDDHDRRRAIEVLRAAAEAEDPPDPLALANLAQTMRPRPVGAHPPDLDEAVRLNEQALAGARSVPSHDKTAFCDGEPGPVAAGTVSSLA